MIYLDNNATTRPLPEVVDVMQRHWRDSFGNPGSRHAAGRRARQVLEAARESIAAILGADPDEVIFTSGGTESNNMAVLGFTDGPPGTIALTAGEHPAVMETCQFLKALGWQLANLPVDAEGLLALPADLSKKADGSPFQHQHLRLVTVILAHNETGVVQDIRPLATACQARGVAFHVDAVQAVGKIPINFHDLGVSSLALGAHKFYGPRGIGALLLRKGFKLAAFGFGGHQEAGRRPGTEVVPLIAGMARALELFQAESEQRMARTRELRDLLEQRLAAACPPVVLNGSRQRRLPNTLNVAFPGVDGEALLVALDLAGIACSLGSTCASGSAEPAPALLAMNRPREVWHSSVRFSVGIETTAAEIDEAAGTIAGIVKGLRTQTCAAMLCLLLFAGLFPAISRADDNWPQFRGPHSTGVGDSDQLPDQWSATENVEWKADIPGRGWSSPIVWGDRIFLTTVENQGTFPDAKKGLYFKGEQHELPDAVHRWKTLCLDLHTGQVLWERTAHEGTPGTTLHIKNSYASETPVTDGKRVYAYFGNLGVYCYDLAGEPVWSMKLEPHATRAGWGTAASPALFQDRLYIVNDNEESSYLLALDAATGKELWRKERDEQSNWSTPFVWQNPLRTELVTAGTNRVRSYDLDGNVLWQLAGMSIITIGTPFAHEGLLYVGSGYVLDLRRPLYAIRPGGTGDISLAANKTSNETIAWCQRMAAPYNPSVLVYRDRLYVLYDKGIFACFDARTGDVVYDKQRIPNGRAFTSSPWAYAGKIFCLNEYGETFVYEAGDEFKPLHINALADDEMCMATPAIAGERLLIRSAVRLYSIKKQTRK